MSEHSPEKDAPHRIDIEQAWDEFTRMTALVDEKDAEDFLAVMYAWRDEAVADATRVIIPPGQSPENDAPMCGHRDCRACPKCGSPDCCWHLDGCDHYRVIPPGRGN